MIGKSNMEEDSVLLQKRSDKPRTINKQNSRQENWQIFKEYYLLKIVITVAVVVFVVGELIHITFFNPKPAMAVMTMGVQTMLENEAPFTETAQTELGIDPKKEFVSITTYFNQEMLMPLMAAGEVDVFLMDRAAFEDLAAAGFLMNLGDFKEIPEDAFCMGQTEEDTHEQPYGIVVTDSEWLAQFDFMSSDDIIFAIAGNSRHMEMTQKFLNLIK